MIRSKIVEIFDNQTKNQKKTIDDANVISSNDGKKSFKPLLFSTIS